MGRIMAIDYGMKRTGLAWTDPLRIIATGIGTIPTPEIKKKLTDLFKSEKVDRVILGMPNLLSGEITDTTEPILKLKTDLEKWFPEIPVELWDESHSSQRAMEEMIRGGLSKKRRADKGLVDEVAATLILQEYLALKS